MTALNKTKKYPIYMALYSMAKYITNSVKN